MRAKSQQHKHWRPMAAALAVSCAAALTVACGTAPASAHWTQPQLAAVEVYDRQDGSVLPVYEKDGRRYVVGTPGHEYTLRVRNQTGGRILAVTSVDGVNVVTGETAAPDQSGYVIDAGGSVDIEGWRKSLDRVAAFYFTDLGDSYAARTGRPGNVGVIGLAVFRERERVVYTPPRDRIAQAQRNDAPGAFPAPRVQAAPAQPSSESPVVEPAPGAPRAGASASAPPMRDEARESNADGRVAGAAKSLASPLGTGHGRNETSYATRVTFDRATRSPAQTLAVQYDRRENLVAMGVLPGTYYARRTPQPFPGNWGFAPDPR